MICVMGVWETFERRARARTGRELMADFLTDRFGRRHNYLRLSLTERCNLRCIYCMPEDGVELGPRATYLSDDELVRVASVFVRGGVDKIRLTGGEPLVRKGVEEIARRIGALEGLKRLSITTNGLLLPERLEALYAAGITEFNISIDTLVRERFTEIARRDGLEKVRRAIDMVCALAEQDERVRAKINCVVIRGVNDDEIADFVELTRAPIDVRFIEHMPFDGNGWSKASVVSMAEMLELIRAKFGEVEVIEGHPSDTAKHWRVPGFSGQFGVIASMTTPFCGGCNRVRVLADGALKVCLFGSREVSLRDAMRHHASDEELRALIGAALQGKHENHAGLDLLAELPNRPMIKIGG